MSDASHVNGVSHSGSRTSGASGTLYVVATPIGNAADITDRARRVLAGADIIAAEDTRATRILLSALGIRNRTVSNHKFNERRQVELLMAELANGKDVALVSDAGTPCVSDPGGIAVAEAAARGIKVTAVCGASSVTAALSICGFPFGSFAFYGFLPRAAKDIQAAVLAAGTPPGVAVFFESPKRVKKSLAVFAETAPRAGICLCNDLSKQYERIYRGTPAAVLAELEQNPSAEKGEYVLVARFAPDAGEAGQTGAGHTSSDRTSADPTSSGRTFDGQATSADGLHTAGGLSPEALLADHLVKNGGTLKDAVAALAARNRGGSGRTFTKKALYEAAVNLKSVIGDNR